MTAVAPSFNGALAACQYPRLLPAPQPEHIEIQSLSPEVIQRLTEALQNNTPTGSHRITAEFASLCHSSINPRLAEDLSSLDGLALDNLANQMCLGVKACRLPPTYTGWLDDAHY